MSDYEGFLHCVYPVFTFKHKCKNNSKASFTLLLLSMARIMSKITLVRTSLNLLHDHSFVINPVFLYQRSQRMPGPNHQNIFYECDTSAARSQYIRCIIQYT